MMPLPQESWQRFANNLRNSSEALSASPSPTTVLDKLGHLLIVATDGPISKKDTFLREENTPFPALLIKKRKHQDSTENRDSLAVDLSMAKESF